MNLLLAESIRFGWSITLRGRRVSPFLKFTRKLLKEGWHARLFPICATTPEIFMGQTCCSALKMADLMHLMVLIFHQISPDQACQSNGNFYEVTLGIIIVMRLFQNQSYSILKNDVRIPTWCFLRGCGLGWCLFWKCVCRLQDFSTFVGGFEQSAKFPWWFLYTFFIRVAPAHFSWW